MEIINDDNDCNYINNEFNEEWEISVNKALRMQRIKSLKIHPPKEISFGNNLIDIENNEKKYNNDNNKNNNNNDNGNSNDDNIELKNDLSTQGKSWHEFYETHENHFFKDRHYLLYAFEPLQNSLIFNNINNINNDGNKNIKILEVGCGVGNTLLPLIEGYNNTYLTGIDHAPSAINILSSNPIFISNQARCKAMVWDVSSSSDSPLKTEEGTYDFVILMFVLSAIHPTKMHIVINNIKPLLKPKKGILLFRDYAIKDLAQVRFNPANRIGPNHYHRSDGTSSFFFSIEGVDRLMIKSKLQKGNLEYVKKSIKNNQTGVVMNRVWINGWYMNE